MKCVSRGLAALSIAALAALAPLPRAAAQAPAPVPAGADRERVSTMIGIDVARSLKPVAADIDLAAFERAVRNAVDGGKPLIDDADATATSQALMQRAAAHDGKQIPGLAPGSMPPAVDRAKAGLFLGIEVGRSLQAFDDEIDLATVMQAVRAEFAGGKPALSEADMQALRTSFDARMRAKLQARAAKAGEENAAAGQRFLAANKGVKGVFTTPSGLQYTVLRQGSGRRPLFSDRVRVNYRGTLLDGTEFDSSDKHGGPTEFGLGQVIAGWTEGLTMMPTGAKYRFWIPGDLAYGAKGSQGIGPNSTLVFDVELLDVL